LTSREPNGSQPRRALRWKGWWRALACLVGAMVLASPTRAAQVGEYDLKAVFLYNFAQFVDWPPDAFLTPDAPFVIGVVGPDPFGDALEEIVRDEYVKGHRFAVERYRSADEIGSCHILFVPFRAGAEIAAVLPHLAARHVLTVGESEDIVKRGVAVGFRMENQRVRIRINLGAARAANLTISSKLLRAAEVVEDAAATNSL
jgi:hypothetical protein